MLQTAFELLLQLEIQLMVSMRKEINKFCFSCNSYSSDDLHDAPSEIDRVLTASESSPLDDAGHSSEEVSVSGSCYYFSRGN